MRVTILVRDFPPAIGGIADHTDRMASELARRGAIVTVVCSAPAETREAFEVRAQVARWDRRGHVQILRAVAETRPDLVLWQYNPFNVGRRGIPSGAARLARALAAQAPLVLFAHELWFPWGREGLRGIAWAVAQRLQTRRVLRAASRVIVTTERRERALRRYAGTMARIPAGPSVEPATSARAERDPTARTATDARARLGIPDDAFVCVHLGAVASGRRFGAVFEAVARVRARGTDVRLVLAGDAGAFDAPPSLNGALVRTGVLARAELSAVLAAADAYVYPDPAGPSVGRRTSLAAALAHGVPIVAFAGPDRAADLADGENVVLVGPHAGDVAAALARLAADRDEARRIGRSGRAAFERSYSWTRIGDALARVLEGAR